MSKKSKRKVSRGGRPSKPAPKPAATSQDRLLANRNERPARVGLVLGWAHAVLQLHLSSNRITVTLNRI